MVDYYEWFMQTGQDFYLPIFTYGTWSLLRLIFIYSHMNNWCCNYINGNGHCGPRLCVTRRSHIFLGCNSNYKSFFGYSLFRGDLVT